MAAQIETPKMLLAMPQLTSLRNAEYLSGYFYDPLTKNVWSNKRSNRMQLLAGAAEYAHRPQLGRRYVLGFRKQTYVTSDFVKAYENFSKTGVGQTWIASHAKTMATTAGKLVDEKTRTHSASAFVSQKGYMLATIGEHDQLIVGKNPMFHLTMTTVTAEAERIARESGLQVVVLHASRSVKVAKTVWE